MADLREAIPSCGSVRGLPPRDLLWGIPYEEKNHVDFIETQFGLIARIGIQNHPQCRSGKAGTRKTIARRGPRAGRPLPRTLTNPRT